LLAPPLVVCTEPCHTSMGRSHPVGENLLNPTSKRLQSLTCTSACHDPHGSDHPKILRLSARELCFSCHDM
jgi:predicted CXXCH cytochrome family protein